MSLTAFPTVVFDATNGSDTLSSGAGPSTAIIGTATSVNSTSITVTVSSGTMSQVAQDGSHVLWITGIGFVRINSFSGSGPYTIVVETALTCTAAACAIGGPGRASLDGTESARLFAATATPTASGASGQWIVQLKTDFTLSAAITLSFTAGTGNLIIQSDGTTVRQITQSANATTFTANTNNRFEFWYCQFRQSNATKTETFTCSQAPSATFRNCICGASDGTNCPLGLWKRSGSTAAVILHNTSVLRTTGAAINGSTNFYMEGSEISRSGGAGISNSGGVLVIRKSIISWNSGDGINSTVVPSVSQPVVIEDCVIDNNTGDGCELSGANLTLEFIVNNQFTNNGTSGTAYGLNLSGSTPHYGIIEYNNFSGNRTANVNGITLTSTNTNNSPGYTDSSSGVRNYKVGTACQGTGFPASTATIAAGQTGTTTYINQGVQQSQASGLKQTNMNGGFQ